MPEVIVSGCLHSQSCNIMHRQEDVMNHNLRMPNTELTRRSGILYSGQGTKCTCRAQMCRMNTFHIVRRMEGFAGPTCAAASVVMADMAQLTDCSIQPTWCHEGLTPCSTQNATSCDDFAVCPTQHSRPSEGLEALSHNHATAQPSCARTVGPSDTAHQIVCPRGRPSCLRACTQVGSSRPTPEPRPPQGCHFRAKALAPPTPSRATPRTP